jgi:hypothetical protein
MIEGFADAFRKRPTPTSSAGYNIRFTEYSHKRAEALLTGLPPL